MACIYSCYMYSTCYDNHCHTRTRSLTGKDQGKDDVFKAMSVTAEEYFTKNKDNKESIAFLYTDGDELDEQLLGFLSIKVDSSPVLFMVDIPNGVKYINEGDINVNEFVKKCEKGEVPSKKLQE